MLSTAGHVATVLVLGVPNSRVVARRPPSHISTLPVGNSAMLTGTREAARCPTTAHTAGLPGLALERSPDAGRLPQVLQRSTAQRRGDGAIAELGGVQRERIGAGEIGQARGQPSISSCAPSTPPGPTR